MRIRYRVTQYSRLHQTEVSKTYRYQWVANLVARMSSGVSASGLDLLDCTVEMIDGEGKVLKVGMVFFA